jgi:hypothetical protein
MWRRIASEVDTHGKLLQLDSAFSKQLWLTRTIRAKAWQYTSYVHHQQKAIRSGSHLQSSQTLRVTSSVLLSTCRCSQTPLELNKVVSDSARAISGAPSRIVKFWSWWDLCTDLQKTLREAETAVQLSGILREPPRPLHSSVEDSMPYSHSSGSHITTRHFILSYSFRVTRFATS